MALTIDLCYMSKLKVFRHFSIISVQRGERRRESRTLTLAEAVLEAALHGLQVPHAAAASGLAANGLDAPVVCGCRQRNTQVSSCKR